MFLLKLGELLEEWTHKKSMGDLARSMSLNIDRVWKKTEGGEEPGSAESGAHRRPACASVWAA